jgi:uncharacterized phosphosugar-binding protein
VESYVTKYFEMAATLLQKVLQESGPAIEQAAQAVADAIAQDKDFLTFGSGHSELVAREAMWRAGGLAPTIAIDDPTGGDAERIEGVAKLILGHYTLRPGSVMAVISNSGINPVPVEAALLSKEAGLTVVAITNLAHSRAIASRHSSGKKLYEVADIVIDTHGQRGDAVLSLPNTRLQTGPTSTLVGVAIMDAIIAHAAALLADQGIEPPLLVSANVPEGDAHNAGLKARFINRLTRFPIDVADLAE